jgi:hypothetical protein
VAALSSDLGKVQQLVEATAEAAGGDPAASAHVSDTVHMLETMRETHVGHLAPRVEACHAAVEGFAAHCLECKVGCCWLGFVGRVLYSLCGRGCPLCPLQFNGSC